MLGFGSKLLSCTKNIITYRHVFDKFMMLSHVIKYVLCLKTNNIMCFFSFDCPIYDNFIFPPYKFSTYNTENDDDLLLFMNVDKNKYIIIVSSA